MSRRLVFFTPALDDRGGVGQRSRLLATSLANRGWRVVVVGRAVSSRRVQISACGNLRTLSVPGFGSDRLATVLFLGCALPIGTVMGARGASFLAMKLFSSSSAAAVCAALTRRGFVSLATSSGADSEITDLLGEGGTGPAARPLSRVLGRVATSIRLGLLRRATHLVAQSASAAEELRRIVPAERVAVVPNPVAVAAPAPLSGTPRALFVGRLARQKDPLTLLEAWRGVVARRADARLTLVGHGGDHEPVETEARRLVRAVDDLARTVSFTGWVDDVTPYLTTCDVFVLPSLTEGMSNALLEACAHGRVVVASDIAANRAVLGDDYPLLFPVKDACRLSELLLLAFDDAAVRSDAVARVTAQVRAFSVEAVMDALEALVAQSSGRGRERRGSGPLSRAM